MANLSFKDSINIPTLNWYPMWDDTTATLYDILLTVFIIFILYCFLIIKNITIENIYSYLLFY